MSIDRRPALIGTTDSLTGTAQALTANGQTITTAGNSGIRVAPTAAYTGIILQAGTVQMQRKIIFNESAFSITFAAAGTSNVADGASCVIPANTQKTFYWNSAKALWYHS